MHFTNVFAFLTAFAASAVMAAPSGPNNDILARGGGGGGGGGGDGGHSCKGDQWYVGWDKKCACPSGCEYDEVVGKCHYPTHTPLTCGYGELLWCARSATDYCQYDAKDERCWTGGGSQIFCAPEVEITIIIIEIFPPPIPHCEGDQHYDYTAKQCVCEAGKVFSNGKCGYPPLQPPICSYGETAYCAKDKDNYCPYDASNAYCLADGHNTVFCCAPPKIKEVCAQKWDY